MPTLRWLQRNKTTSVRPRPWRLTFDALEDRLAPATLTVNTIADGDVRDNVLTLREAIRVANGALGLSLLTAAESGQISGALETASHPTTLRDKINFSIGAGTQTIAPTTLLPEITQPVELDGTAPATLPTQEIELSGGAVGVHTGLKISAGSSIVRGLTVNRFNLYQIQLINKGDNRIVGNHVGVNVAGDAKAQTGASATGVYLDNVSHNTIGGAAAADRNVISGNSRGISVVGATTAATNRAHHNLILGNYVGTNATGLASLSNGIGIGVHLHNAGQNTIGTPGTGNVIAGNGLGIAVSGFTAGINLSADNIIQGNYLGVNAADSAPLANSTNVLLGTVKRQLVGGTAGAGNRIAGGANGIKLDIVTDSRIQGNRIGTGPNGTEDWGSNIGIQLDGRCTNNRIGGRDEDDGAADGVVEAANVIAYNNYGIIHTGTQNTQNAILGNSIHSNTALGIQLQGNDLFNGVTPNDEATSPYDADTGPNGLQNFPVLTLVANAGGSTHVEGTLKSQANTTYRLEFFANPTPELPSHFGEGRTLLGVAHVTTDATGLADFTGSNPLLLPANLLGIQYVTATASVVAWDHDNNPATPAQGWDHDSDPATPLHPTSTSEFSLEYQFNGAVNNPPAALDRTYFMALGAMTLPIDLRDLVSDAETPDNQLIYQIVIQPNNAAPLSQGLYLHTLTPQPGFFGTITFTYQVTDTGGLSSAVKTVTINVVPPDLHVGLTVVGQAIQGEDLQYVISVVNNGLAPASSIQVDFAVPAEMVRGPLRNIVNFFPQANLVSVSPDVAHQATYQLVSTIGGGIAIRFDFGLPLNPVSTGDGATFVVTVRPIVCGKTIKASTSVTTNPPDAFPADNNAVASTFVNCRQSDVRVRVIGPNSLVNVGDVVTYQIEVTNGGPQTAHNVRVLNVLPYELDSATRQRIGCLANIVIGVPSAGIAQSIGNQEVAWDVGTLASGAKATLTIQGTVQSKAANKIITNRASVAADEPDASLVNNSAQFRIQVAAEPDLSVNISTPATHVKVNAPVVFTIKVKNNGPGMATGVNLRVQIPVEMDFEAITPRMGAQNPVGGVLQVPVGQLAAGVETTFKLRVLPRVGGFMTTVASVAGSQRDRDPNNNSLTFSLTAGPQVELIKDGDFTSAELGLPTPWFMSAAGSIVRGRLQLRPFRGLLQSAEQTVVIPATAAVAMLSFTFDVTAPDSRNQLFIDITGGVVVPYRFTLNGGATPGPFFVPILVNPGQLVHLRFSALTSNDIDAAFTSWRIDDVSLCV